MNTANPTPSANTAGTCPWCAKPMPPAATLCLECGYNTQSHIVATTNITSEADTEPPQRTAAERYKLAGLDAFIDREIPLAILAGSFAFILITHLVDSGFSNLFTLIFSLIFITTVHTGWTLAAMSLMEFWFGGTFGPFKTQFIKIAAVVSVGLALATLMEAVAPGLGASIFLYGGILVSADIVIFFLLVKWLFELDILWTITLAIFMIITSLIASAIGLG